MQAVTTCLNSKTYAQSNMCIMASAMQAVNEMYVVQNDVAQ